jgi:hypothetical protein
MSLCYQFKKKIFYVDMALFEQTPSRGGSRFGKLSSNMFFTRNTAKPKRVRHIEGILSDT